MQSLEDIVRDETVSAQVASRPNLHYLPDRSLDRFFELQMALKSSETLVKWIEGQFPEMPAETSATLEARVAELGSKTMSLTATSRPFFGIYPENLPLGLGDYSANEGSMGMASLPEVAEDDPVQIWHIEPSRTGIRLILIARTGLEQRLGQLSSQQSSSASAQLMQDGRKHSHSPPYAPDLESSTVNLFKGLTLDSPWIFPELHRTIQSIKATICGIPYSVQSSSVPDLQGGRRVQVINVAKSQGAIVSGDMDPFTSHETIQEGADTAFVDDVMSDDEDISTIDGADRGQRGWIIVPGDENCGTLG
ncbi:hypothetical protein BDR22DRAFT_885412 [Usnea florida]